MDIRAFYARLKSADDNGSLVGGLRKLALHESLEAMRFEDQETTLDTWPEWSDIFGGGTLAPSVAG